MTVDGVANGGVVGDGVAATGVVRDGVVCILCSLTQSKPGFHRFRACFQRLSEMMYTSSGRVLLLPRSHSQTMRLRRCIALRPTADAAFKLTYEALHPTALYGEKRW